MDSDVFMARLQDIGKMLGVGTCVEQVSWNRDSVEVPPTMQQIKSGEAAYSRQFKPGPRVVLQVTYNVEGANDG